jgi:Leucine-rich repeat (LRR) protein
MFFETDNSRKKHLISWAKDHKIELPTKLEELEQVTKLDIRLRGLTKLPKEIDNLPNLTEIDGEFNEFTELPWEFGKLKNLKHVNFGHNKLTDIPGVICQIANLETLNLESNSIKKVSSVIANLEDLIDLNLSFNHINDLPEEIGHLKHLVKLNLAANNLSSLPPSMHRLYSLAELKLWKNNITEIPDFIKDLPNLKNIELETDTEKINQKFIHASINNDLHNAEKLLLLGADINYKWLNYGNLPFTTPLFEAHSVEMIKFLIEHGADTSIKRELIKSTSSIKVWESDKKTVDFETIFNKKHPPEVAKYIKTLSQKPA